MEEGVREGEDTCGVTCCALAVFLNDNYDFMFAYVIFGLVIQPFWHCSNLQVGSNPDIL